MLAQLVRRMVLAMLQLICRCCIFHIHKSVVLKWSLLPKLIIYGFDFVEGSGHTNLEKYMYLFKNAFFFEACNTLVSS